MKKKILKIRNIYKTYRIKKRFFKKTFKKALININFDIFQGEIFCLLGVNGAGKTTLSTIIASLHPPTKGDIFFNDKSIYKNLIYYRNIIGFCPQNQNLDINLTIRQNLIFQGRYYGISKIEAEKKADDLLEKFELKNYAKYKVDILSGGYKQRFLIAKTLIHNPKIIILDEPTVGLDANIRHNIWDYIKLLKKEKKSVLLTTHYLDEAEKLSDRVCVIDEGKIKIIDTPKNLKKDLKKENLEEVFLHILKGENL